VTPFSSFMWQTSCSTAFKLNATVCWYGSGVRNTGHTATARTCSEVHVTLSTHNRGRRKGGQGFLNY